MSEHCGYVVRINELTPHSNADRLQIANIFTCPVIVDLNVHIGDVGVYFPSDIQLSEEYCKVNDLVRRKDENGNSCGGYLDPVKRNIKPLKLRGERSDGLYMPLTSLAEFCKVSDLKVGDKIDVLNGVEICRKYIPAVRVSHGSSGSSVKRAKANFAPTFYEHVETEQLAYNLNRFKVGDTIELTLKMHGTSGRTGYLPLVRERPRTFLQKLFHRPATQYTEYGYVTGTRRVVLKEREHQANDGFYGDNEFRYAMEDKFRGKLHKGEVVYYEIVGYVNKDTPIMGSVSNSKISDKAFTKQYGPVTEFSYGCCPVGEYEAVEHGHMENGEPIYIAPRCDVYVYRMTMVNEDGDVVEYSPDQMRYRCQQMGIKCVPVFERFVIPETELLTVDPGDYVLRKVEQYYDGPDPVGHTHIREGVVVRIVNSGNSFAVYKHKNWYFKALTNIIKDSTTTDQASGMSQDILEEL